jgi:hypothetical protein
MAPRRTSMTVDDLLARPGPRPPSRSPRLLVSIPSLLSKSACWGFVGVNLVR